MFGQSEFFNTIGRITNTLGPRLTPMWNWIGYVVVGITGGAISSLLTTYFQHRNWTCQRRAELRLTTIHDIERICAEFITYDQRPERLVEFALYRIAQPKPDGLHNAVQPELESLN